MKRSLITLAAVGLVTGLGLVSAQPVAAAQNYTVCANGCPYTTIQAAINGSSVGATITVAPGTYVENVVVNKSVTLEGKNQASTRILPSFSNPICSPGSLCGGAASSIILVEAD